MAAATWRIKRRFHAGVEEIGVEWIREAARRLSAAATPGIVTVDAFGVPAPAKAEAAAQYLRERSDGREFGIVIDPGDREMFDAFLEYFPYSAHAEIGRSRAGEPILEVFDGEWVGVHATEIELQEAGIDLTGLPFRPF